MGSQENINYLLKRAEELHSSMQLIYEMESRDNSEYSKMNAFASHKTFATNLFRLVQDVKKEFPDADFYWYDVTKMKGPFDSVYGYRKDIMDGVFIEVGKIRAFLQSKLGKKHEEIEEIINLITHRLRSVIRSLPSDEKDIQDKIEDLLIGKGFNKGTDFIREAGRVKTGIKESIPDFVFKNLSFCIEVKLVKDASGPKKVTEEMNADFTSYGTEYENIFVIVYDIGGNIQNTDEFKYKLNGRHIYIEVVKH